VPADFNPSTHRHPPADKNKTKRPTRTGLISPSETTWPCQWNAEISVSCAILSTAILPRPLRSNTIHHNSHLTGDGQHFFGKILPVDREALIKQLFGQCARANAEIQYRPSPVRDLTIRH